MDDVEGTEATSSSYFQLEGSLCFMRCPPGFTPEFQLYDTYPNGDKKYVIYLVAIAEIKPINIFLSDSASLEDKVG